MDRGSPLFPEDSKRHRVYRGLTERQEHIFTWVAVVIVLLYATLWINTILEIKRTRNTPVAVQGGAAHDEPAAPPESPIESITSMIGPELPHSFLSDAMLGFLHPLRGESGNLRYAPALPGSRVVQSVPGGAMAIFGGGQPVDFRAPRQPGIYPLTVAINDAQKPVENMSVVSLVPITAKKQGRIGTYQLGTWPFERGGRPRTPRYAAPPGFIQVTPQNQDFQISEHFRVRQFLTHDQVNVWPKYVWIDPLLVDKLELTIAELNKMGVHVTNIHIMSGFRTPRYNAGGGNTQGRANLSRHMYGDASDVYVDNNRDGQPDDITGDGRVTTADAEKFAKASERVEQQYRDLVGGIGVYSACCGHGPFTHVDVRGFRARWRGSGSG